AHIWLASAGFRKTISNPSPNLRCITTFHRLCLYSTVTITWNSLVVSQLVHVLAGQRRIWWLSTVAKFSRAVWHGHENVGRGRRVRRHLVGLVRVARGVKHQIHA